MHSNKYVQKYELNQLQFCHSNKYLQKYELIKQLNQFNQLINQLNTLKWTKNTLNYVKHTLKQKKTKKKKQSPIWGLASSLLSPIDPYSPGLGMSTVRVPYCAQAPGVRRLAARRICSAVHCNSMNIL